MIEIIDLIQNLSHEVRTIKAYIQQIQKSRLKSFTEEWIDGQDVMQTIHISKRTLQSLRDSNTLPYSRINGKFYYKLSDLENLMEKNYSHSKKSGNGNK